MPRPGPTENEDEFIGRCMGDADYNRRFPDNRQRYAVCQSLWDNQKAEAPEALQKVKDKD